MATGDAFVLKDVCAYLGKNCINVFYYEQINGSNGAQELADTYFANITPLTIEVQSTGAVHTAIEVRNVDNPEDFYTLVPSSGNVGLLTGDGMPRYNAWGFRKNRANSLYRNGAFRVPGVTESTQANGAPTSGALEDLGTLADAMGSDLIGTSGDKWALRIPSGSFVGGARPLPTLISSVQFVRMTTQNSRKG